MHFTFIHSPKTNIDTGPLKNEYQIPLIPNEFVLFRFELPAIKSG